MTFPRHPTELNYKELSDGLADGKAEKDIVFTAGPVKKPRNNEESRAQRQVIRWWELAGCRVHKLSHTLLHSVPNGGFRSVVTASIMKAEGQKRGVFDLKLNVCRQGKAGLWVEMKAASGVLSREQREFMLAVEQQGYATAVCRTANDAIDTIEKYLKS